MNLNCPRCRATGTQVSRHGTYFRRSDSRHIQRFRCGFCQRSFSRATGSACFGQKKRRINHPLMQLLASGISMRRAAILLKVSKNTVSLRLPHLGHQARSAHERWLASLAPITHVQFDDLVTLEHTKCKPLSVCVAVSAKERWILGTGVARIPASGSLAAISRKKYGKRSDESRAMRHELLASLKPVLAEKVLFETDGHKQYPFAIAHNFPSASHRAYPSIRGCVTGQGELKKTQYDPLFSINHTLAMLRANINRLIRRTWCTTKVPNRLLDHLWIYIRYHNRVIDQNLSKMAEVNARKTRS